MLLKFK